MSKKLRSIVYALSILFSTSCLLGQAWSEPFDQVDRHLIFLGDSLSDTGNYPEPANVSHPVLKNFNLYVPVSNPVSAQNSGISQTFLKNSLGDLVQQGKINSEEKTLYSVNWPLYLTYRSSVYPLITWFHMQTQHLSADNINYAWASAQTGDPSGKTEANGACYHDDGSIFPGECDEISVLKNRNIYVKHTANNPNFDQNTKYLYDDLQIPDLGKQISFYLDDTSEPLQDNTVFFIYIGNNDIGHFLKKNIIKIVVYPVALFQNIIDSHVSLFARNVKVAVHRIESAYQKAPNKHYKVKVLTLMHLSNLAEGYSYTHPSIFGKPVWIPLISYRIQAAINNSVDSYNQDLKNNFADDSHVQVIDSGAFLNQLASSSKFKDAVDKGKACVNDSAYVQPNTEGTNNCHYTHDGQSAVYFSWNNAHLTSPVNLDLAKEVAKS